MMQLLNTNLDYDRGLTVVDTTQKEPEKTIVFEPQEPEKEPEPVPVAETINPVIDRQPTRTIQENDDMSIRQVTNQVVDTGVKMVDRITSFPEQIRDVADDVNDSLVKAAERVQNEFGQTAEKNLKAGYLERQGRALVNWVTGNPLLAVVAVVGLIVIIRRA